ncbi:hypothetical protein BDK51DRAFT_29677 [Blyttiomyces helicus]|uniref:Uncharacterized protein n=1 Tax=Blyttiomyces helicus TaxID=388810 RepID=A0A4P9WG76_9FUNG|nr:hypothetical protein BDK51DRAFT_29677 [Blyttiomyces helicus]|eukprot:RKO89456.1 hypothetical protein BDK51DRAFT_29677 [Blyttiomyces helicus]
MVAVDEIKWSTSDSGVIADAPSGLVIRKGTIAATIASVAEIDAHLHLSPSPSRSAAIRKTMDDITPLLPTLHATLFGLFHAADWLRSDASEGRALVGAMAVRAFPDMRSEAVDEMLREWGRRARAEEFKVVVEEALQGCNSGIQGAFKINGGW